MRFVVFSEATAATDENGGPFVAGDLATIAGALEVQLNRDVGSWWGGNHRVDVGSGLTLEAGDVACAVVDALPEAPGAVAYHTVTGDEVPAIFVAKGQCNAILSGADSIVAAFSHELVETVVNAFCNAWRDDGQGWEWAQEPCDPVQEDTYAIDGVAVSNFVLPAYFGLASVGPFSYLGTTGAETLSGPFRVAPGGYAVKRPVGGGEVQVTGEIAPRRKAKKRNWTSRTFRLGARV